VTPMIAWYWLIPAALVPCIVGMWVTYKVMTRFFLSTVVVHYRSQGLNTKAVRKRIAEFFDNHKMEQALSLAFSRKDYRKWSDAGRKEKGA